MTLIPFAGPVWNRLLVPYSWEMGSNEGPKYGSDQPQPSPVRQSPLRGGFRSHGGVILPLGHALDLERPTQPQQEGAAYDRVV